MKRIKFHDFLSCGEFRSRAPTSIVVKTLQQKPYLSDIIF